jgi:hypothetical protein
VVKTKTVSQTFVTYGGADKGRKFDEKEVEVVKEIIKEKIIEKPIEIVRNLSIPFKRGTKQTHNPDLADPNLK